MIYHYHELSDALARVTQEDIIVFPTDTVYGIYGGLETKISNFNPRSINGCNISPW